LDDINALAKDQITQDPGILHHVLLKTNKQTKKKTGDLAWV